MSARLAESINTHRYPGLLYRHPRLLSLLHLAAGATTLRTWYVRRALSRILGARKGPFRYLDAGCGAGDFLLPYARRFPAGAFLGVDRAADNVELCARYVAATGLGNVAVRQADLEAFIPPEPVDVIACITVLQYTGDDRQVLRNFYRSLEADGLLVLYVPVHNRRLFRWYGALLDRHFRAARYDAVQQRRRIYTPADLNEKLREAGFRIRSSAFAYGTAGKAYYEVYSLCLLAASNLHWLLSLLLLPPFVLLVYPVLLLLMGIDFVQTHRSGNGLLIVAQKSAVA